MAQDQLSPSRMEAFSDGIIAVIITIMVLELKVPSLSVGNWQAIRQEAPLVLVYLLSFVQIGIYWVNHHYLLDDLDHVTHGILWSNLGLLFALSLIPAATDWVAVRGISAFSISLYSVACAFPGLFWMILSSFICTGTGKEPASGFKQQAVSVSLYVGAIFVSRYSPHIALGMIGLVAVRWLFPPRRIVELTDSAA